MYMSSNDNLDKIKQVSNTQLLNYIIKNDIINFDDTRSLIYEMNKQEALKKHTYAIWQGKNGKYYTTLPDSSSPKGTRQIMRNSMDKLNDVIAEFYMNTEVDPTIEEVFQTWVNLKYSRGEICKGTLDRYLLDFEKFFKYNKFYKRRISRVTENDLENFMCSIIVEYHLTYKSFSNVRTLIYGIFKYAKKEEYTNISITTFIKDLEISNKLFTKRIVKKEEQIFMQDEIPAIQYYLETHPSIIHLGILLTFYTGVRAGELSTIKISDINFDQRTIFIQRTEIKYKNDKGKTIRDVRDFPKTEAGIRYIVLTDKAMEIIQRILAIQHDTDWLMEFKGKRIRGQMFSLYLYRACDKLHIERRSIHKIRKTYITNLLDAEVDDAIVMEQVGHSNIETTQRYYYYSNRTHDTKLQQLESADVRMKQDSIPETTVTPIKKVKRTS